MAQAIREETAPLRAYLVLGLGVLAVGLAAILIRLAQGEGMPSLMIAGGRLLIATVILTPPVLRRRIHLQQIQDLSGRDRILVLISGLFLAIHFACWVTSLEYTTVLISVVLVTTTPIWVALLERFILGARLSRWVILGLVLALAGGVVIGLSDTSENAIREDQIYGGLLALGGAMAVAVYLIIGRKIRPHLALTPYIWLVYGIAALILSAVLVARAIPVTGYPVAGYLWILAVALIPQLIGHSSFNYALAYLPATYVSVSTQIEPILSAAFAYFLFAEIPAGGQILGGAVILAGVTLASLGQRGK